MLTFTRTEFASRRRGLQDRAIADLLRPIEEALNHYAPEGNWWRSLLGPTHDLFREVLTEDSGGDVRDDPRAWARLAKRLEESLTKTTEPDRGTADNLAVMLSTAAINAAVTAAAANDPEVLVLEWTTMHDTHVRAEHKRVDGQQRLPGEAYDVDGAKMMYPGDTRAPVQLWIQCRCMLRPELAMNATATREPISMAARTDIEKPTGRVVVALPAKDHPVHGIGDEEKHMSLAWLGKPEENSDLDMEAVRASVAGLSQTMSPFEVPVSGIEPMGTEGAQVWRLGPQAESVHLDLLHEPEVEHGHNAVKQHVGFKPHVTIGYGESVPPEAADVSSILFDRLAVWEGEDRTEFALGGPMADDDETAKAVEPDDIALAAPVAWHGVLAPEGVWSGDKRQFAKGSLRFRDLPLPLTWQKASSAGHDGSVVVAKIEQAARVGAEIRARGHWLSIPESDEVVGLLAEFGKFGVSVDADDSEYEFNDDTGEMTFSSARIASASVVAIPAFAEAYIAMGDGGEEFLSFAAGDVMPPSEQVDDPECDPEAPDYEDCLARKQVGAAAQEETFKRGPGWITNPEDTRRIHDYWTKPGEPGYVKIGWGAPGGGDFQRCRVMVGEEIAENSPDKVRFLNQICAQWHHDATGFWPGHAPTEQSVKVPEGEMAPAVSLVASGGVDVAVADWFHDPQLPELTPLTITEDGQVFGHLAGWETCHTGYPGQCVAPPHSTVDYAYFLTGAVRTDEGLVPVGQLTVGGGHADSMLSMRRALRHYDDTATVVADIAVGEDEFGIWMAGRVRPGTPQAKVDELLAAAVSGDWRARRPGDQDFELVAALGVNSPGFPVPRVGISNGDQVSLVAAGVVHGLSMQVGTFDWDAITDRVLAEIAVRAANRERMASLAAKVGAVD